MGEEEEWEPGILLTFGSLSGIVYRALIFWEIFPLPCLGLEGSFQRTNRFQSR